ncbi:invertebrate-type lysozyme 6-like [Daphnia carinata]|uniref:invertebrate-type lysozyme 6-like n=1 Tax=Daphnia carinata TaxID=120202 RepID=UPI00257A7782|nr:invertebrate-type lysozyme 6-like [Daphnia carinata]
MLLFCSQDKRMLNSLAAAYLLVAVFVFSPTIQGQEEELAEIVIPDDCMQCLCEASSYCNLTAPCTTGSQYLCGPFLMGVNYWADAGQPMLTPDEDPNGAFEACARDLECAKKTVRSYMTEFAQDCTEDGVIDCEDFARIHVLGKSDSCFAKMEGLPFYRVFRECRDKPASV